jgi:hypothetical protein
MLSDPSTRKEYDMIIFGATNSRTFYNQDVYEYYRSKIKTGERGFTEMDAEEKNKIYQNIHKM